MKRSDVEKRLRKVKFVLNEDGENKEYSIDNFSSFLITQNELISNDSIQSFFDNKKFTPTDIFENRNDLFKEKLRDYSENKKINQKHFLEESFKFPDHFFNSGKDLNNKYMFVGLNVAERAGVNDYGNWGNFRDVKMPTNTFKLYTQFNDLKFKGCYITDIIKSVVDSDSGNIKRNFFLPEKAGVPNKLSFLKYPGINDELDSQRVAEYTKWQYKYYNDKRAVEYKKVADLMNLISETFIKDETQDIKESYELHYVKRLTGEQLLEKNRDIIEQSVKCFVSECLAVHPDRLVALGESANSFLIEMGDSPLFNDYVDELAKGKDVEYIKNLVNKNRFEVTHYAAYNVEDENGNPQKGNLRFNEWMEQAPMEVDSKEEKLNEELEKNEKDN